MVKSRILIAEDEPHLREVLRMQLELAGFEVFEAADGAEGVEAAIRERPDLRVRAERGELLFGTIDSWLIYRLTGSAAALVLRSGLRR